MADSQQGATGTQPTTPKPVDPIAELDEILAEVLRHPRIWFTDEDYERMEQEPIGYDESVHPYHY